MNAVDIEYMDGSVVFAEIFIWPDQDVFIVQVWPFIIGSL